MYRSAAASRARSRSFWSCAAHLSLREQIFLKLEIFSWPIRLSGARHGRHCREQSSSPRNLHPIGFCGRCDGSRVDLSGRTVGIASHPAQESGGGVARSPRRQVSAAGVWEFLRSCRSPHPVEEELLLRGRKEVEEPLQRHQQYVGISVLQIRSGQKVGADHLQTVAA
jgi:hypothetical protein